MSAGFVSWLDRESPDDAIIVKILLDAGAVVYARTTEPQALVSISQFPSFVDLWLMSCFRGRWLLKPAAISPESPPTHIIPLSHQVVLPVENQHCKPSMAALWELVLISVCCIRCIDSFHC